MTGKIAMKHRESYKAGIFRLPAAMGTNVVPLEHATNGRHLGLLLADSMCELLAT